MTNIGVDGHAPLQNEGRLKVGDFVTASGVAELEGKQHQVSQVNTDAADGMDTIKLDGIDTKLEFTNLKLAMRNTGLSEL